MKQINRTLLRLRGNDIKGRNDISKAENILRLFFVQINRTQLRFRGNDIGEARMTQLEEDYFPVI